MSRFTPTLRLDIPQADVAGIEKREGRSIEQIQEALTHVFTRISLFDKPLFTAETITDIESGETLKKFEVAVVGKFYVDDLLHLKLSTGDVVALKFNVV